MSPVRMDFVKKKTSSMKWLDLIKKEPSNSAPTEKILSSIHIFIELYYSLFFYIFFESDGIAK